MHKNLITPLVLICTLYCSCSKKSSQPGPQNGGSGNIKIELVSGNNQTDTIGRPLANPIVVKVTKTNGASLSSYELLYEGSGCNEDRLDQLNIGADGTANYNWYLAGGYGTTIFESFCGRCSEQKN